MHYIKKKKKKKKGVDIRFVEIQSVKMIERDDRSESEVLASLQNDHPFFPFFFFSFLHHPCDTRMITIAVDRILPAILYKRYADNSKNSQRFA